MSKNQHRVSRRRFLQGSSAAMVAMSALRPVRGANEKIVVGVMGTSRNEIGGDGRGTHLARCFAECPDTEVAYVCDVDKRNIDKAIESVSQVQAQPPKGVGDFRRILDDPVVDALVIATPDHWHAPAAILACKAGKHVYVEKPCSHNGREAELLVEAARKYKRCVQHGTQRRTWPVTIEAMEKLRSGAIGTVYAARCWYFSSRPSTGRGQEVPVPDWLDWPLWQGPAPERPYRDNYAHYRWHWFWHWGTAELGNNGVHTIDLCRWGLGVDYPRQVTCTGGRYRYDDDQETPDTTFCTMDFGGKTITWEGRSCWGRTALDPQHDVAFYGDQGILTIAGGAYHIYDPKGKEIGKGASSGGDATHVQNFLDAIRQSSKLNAEIEEGCKSVLLCHLGNISYRLGRTIRLDPDTHQIAGDKEASALWTRQYRPGWEPTV